jgi:hypothetical protein
MALPRGVEVRVRRVVTLEHSEQLVVAVIPLVAVVLWVIPHGVEVQVQQAEVWAHPQSVAVV